MKVIRLIALLVPMMVATGASALAQYCVVSASYDRDYDQIYTVSINNEVIQSSYSYNEAISFAELDVRDGACMGVWNDVGRYIPGYPVRFIYYPYINGVYFLWGYHPGYYPWGYRPGFYHEDRYYVNLGYRGALYYGEHRGGGRYEGYRGGGGEHGSYRPVDANSGHHAPRGAPAPHRAPATVPSPPRGPVAHPAPRPVPNPGPARTNPAPRPAPAPHTNPAPRPAPAPHTNPAPRPAPAPHTNPAPRPAPAPAPRGGRH